MGDKVTKTVKVDRSKVDDWEDYVDENAEVDSISHLIRLSVHEHINTSEEPERRPSPDRDATDSGKVLDHLRRIQTGLSDLDDRLTGLERAHEGEATIDLERAIFNHLAEYPTPKNLPEEDYRSDEDVTSARELGQLLAADQNEVDETLRRMDENTGAVKVVEADSGELYAWRNPYEE